MCENLATLSEMYTTLEVHEEGPIATVALNRPDVRNAFNAEMIAELTDAFRALGARSDLRAVTLRGNGPSFSAGADVTWMRASLDFSEDENRADARRMSEMFSTIDSVPVPVLGRVHGASLGGGMGLMAVCDVVIAEEGTVFGFTEAKLGIVPAVISPFVLAKTGPGWARALFATAERFGVEVAQRIGLVHWVAEAGSVDALVARKVDEVLSSGPEAAREAKRLIRDVVDLEREPARELTASRIAALRAGEEGQEGLRAFLEKRPARWKLDR